MIETADLTLATEGGANFNAYLSRPPHGRNPGVVLLHDMFGLFEPIRTVADRCAQRGIAALAPNLFWRSEYPGVIPYDAAQHPRAWERLKALDLNGSARDMKIAVDWLRGQPFCNGKVATIGFCGGGRLAFLVAARAGVDAAASLYGLGISQHLGDLGRISCPLQLHYGGNDQHVPQSEVDAVAAGVQGHPGTEVFVYPGAGHSFANPVRPTYDVAATELAWSRIDRMLDRLR
jgi:carboxymethylenebutenolidase